MRSAGNFSPEWGYLAPAPSFMRTARIVLVATAIGATAGAGVVLSLIDRPAAEADKTSVAAHAIVTSAQAAPASTTPLTGAAVHSTVAPVTVTALPQTVPPAAQPQAATPIAPQVATQPQAATPIAPQVATQPPLRATATQSTAIAAPQPAPPNAAAESSRASEENIVAAPKPRPGMAALSQTPPATEAAPSDMPDDATVAPEAVPPQKKAKHHVADSTAKNQPPAGLGTALRRLFGLHTGTSYYPNR